MAKNTSSIGGLVLVATMMTAFGCRDGRDQTISDLREEVRDLRRADVTSNTQLVAMRDGLAACQQSETALKAENAALKKKVTEDPAPNNPQFDKEKLAECLAATCSEKPVTITTVVGARIAYGNAGETEDCLSTLYAYMEAWRSKPTLIDWASDSDHALEHNAVSAKIDCLTEQWRISFVAAVTTSATLPMEAFADGETTYSRAGAIIGFWESNYQWKTDMLALTDNGQMTASFGQGMKELWQGRQAATDKETKDWIATKMCENLTSHTGATWPHGLSTKQIEELDCKARLE